MDIRDLRWKVASSYAYHGTREAVVPRIQVRGLIPGAAPAYDDMYSEYDDGHHLFFADDPATVRGAYGDTLLRFPWPTDAKPDVNKYGRHLPHQFVSKLAVPAVHIEVEVGEEWVALGDLVSTL